MLSKRLISFFAFAAVCALPPSARANELPDTLHGIWVPTDRECTSTIRSSPISAIEIDSYVIYRRDDRCTVFRTIWDGDRLRVAVSCLNGYLTPEKSGNDTEWYDFYADLREDHMGVSSDRVGSRQERLEYKRCTKTWQPDPEQVELAKRLRGRSYSIVMFPTTVEKPLNGAESEREATVMRDFHVDEQGVLHFWLTDTGSDDFLPISTKLRVGEVVDLEHDGRVLWWLQGDRFIYQTEYATYFDRFILPTEPSPDGGGRLQLKCKVAMHNSMKAGHDKAFRFLEDGSLVEHISTSWKGTTCTTGNK